MNKLLNDNQRDEMTGGFLSGKEFEGKGLELGVISMVAEKADNPKYGAKEDGGGLKKGEQWIFTFKTANGVEKILKMGTTALSTKIARIDPEIGEMVRITRTGEGFDTRWSVARPGGTLDEVQYEEDEVVEV